MIVAGSHFRADRTCSQAINQLDNSPSLHVYGLVHTETFPCVFVLFQVNNELVVVENSKQYKNERNVPKMQENVFPCMYGADNSVSLSNC